MRKLLASLACLFLLCAPAHAQKTKAALTTEINTNWPDNSTGAITPALLRNTVIDIVNSYYDLNGGSTLACAASQVVSGFPTLSSLACSTIKTKMVSNTTFYVNGDPSNPQTCGATGTLTCQPGNDSVTALQSESVNTPFLTLAAAISAVLTQIDWNGFRASINLAHGSPATNYGSASCAIPQGQFGALFITGDDASSNAVTLTAPPSSYALYATHYCIIRLRSVNVVDSGSSIWGLTTDNYGGIDLQNVTFGAFSSPAFHAGQSGHMELITPVGSATDSVFITGNMPEFLLTDNGGVANFGESDDLGNTGFTINIASGLTFSNALIKAASGGFLWHLSAGTFTGGHSYTGLGMSLSGPGFMTSGGVACATIVSNSSLGCQLINGFKDDAGDVMELSTGNVGIGVITPLAILDLSKNAAAPPNNLATSGPRLTGPDATNYGWNVVAAGAIATNNFMRGDGTIASPTALQLGDEIGRESYSGYNGITYAISKARQNCFAAENWTGTNNGTYCSVFATPTGSTTIREIMRVQASGGLSVGNANLATDGGAGVIVGTGYQAGATAGVTCSGTPTASFNSVNGIVTHC